MSTTAKPGHLAARKLLIAHLDIHPGKTVDGDLDPAEVGIVGDPAHRGGYHVGQARVLAGDYSVVESSRDRAGLDGHASALDVGWFSVSGRGRTWTLRDFSTWLVGLCVAGDPDCVDVREVIYSPDGKTVRRWDRLGRRTSGDSSHLTHTHISEFRDAAGDRMVRIVTRWLAHIGLIAGAAGGEGDDMFEQADRDKLTQIFNLVTAGNRGPGLAVTAGGGVPVDAINRKFWDVGQTQTALAKLVEDVRQKVDALAARDGAAPVGQVTDEELAQAIERALRTVFAGKGTTG